MDSAQQPRMETREVWRGAAALAGAAVLAACGGGARAGTSPGGAACPLPEGATGPESALPATSRTPAELLPSHLATAVFAVG